MMVCSKLKQEVFDDLDSPCEVIDGFESKRLQEFDQTVLRVPILDILGPEIFTPQCILDDVKKVSHFFLPFLQQFKH